MDKNVAGQFVPYDVAQFMKIKEFNEQCLGYYAAQNAFKLSLFEMDAAINCNEYCGGFTRLFRPSEQIKNCTAPTWAQALDWFESQYKMYLTPIYNLGSVAYFCQILNNNIRLQDCNLFETHYNRNKYDSLREAFAIMILHILREPTHDELQDAYDAMSFTKDDL